MALFRRPAAIIVAAGLVVLVAGTLGLLLTRHSTAAVLPPKPGVGALPAPTGPIVAPPQSSDPVAVASPVTLGLQSNGALQVPTTTTVAGWYTGSPRPGAIGSAIIVGHVDSYQGDGVFFPLGTL